MQSSVLCHLLSPMKERGLEFPWNRIIKRKFIEENSLYFTKTRAYEDTIYALNCFQNAEKIAFIADDDLRQGSERFAVILQFVVDFLELLFLCFLKF